MIDIHKNISKSEIDGLKNVFKALIATIAFQLSLNCYSISDLKESSQIDAMQPWFRFLWDIKESLNGSTVEALVLFISLILLFSYKGCKTNNICLKKVSSTIAVLLTFFYVFGDSFKRYDSWIGVFGSFRNIAKAGIKYYGAAIAFYSIIVLLYNIIDGAKSVKTKSDCSYRKKDSLGIFLICFTVIIICWIPYAYSYYPGLTNYDFFDMLDTFYGNDTNSLRVVIPISDTVTLNNNNPVLQVLMAVGTMKIGNVLGSPYYGIAVFCYTQMITFAAILSYSLVFMRKRGIRPIAMIIILTIYALLPWNPNFALSTLKDTNYSFITLIFIMLLIDMTIDTEAFFDRKEKLIALAFIELLMMLLRNNGIYVLALLLITELIVFNKYYKKVLLSGLVPILIYSILITRVLYPQLGISPGSKAEMYSLPIQQIARLINEKGDQIEKEDQLAIAKVLNDYDEIADRYDPELADPVKSRFNKYASSDDLKGFIHVWFKYLRRYPGIYIQAAICDCYGYFYPEAEHWLVYTQIEPPGEEYGLKSPENRSSIRNEMNQLAYIVHKLPGVGMLMSVGFYSWLMIVSIGYLIYSEKKKLIFIWLPSVILLLTVLAGPANTMPRYIYPIIICTPLLVAFTIYSSEKKEKKYDQ